MQFQKGDRVRNNKIANWGIGEILEVLTVDKYKIFFVNAGEKTVDASVADLFRLEGKEAHHPLLDNLRLPNKGKRTEFRSMQKMVNIFLGLFPKGFYEDEYMDKERGYKVEAHKYMLSVLSKSNFDQLIDSQMYEDICKNALRVANKTNLIFPNEKMALKDGLNTEGNKKYFSNSLYELLYGADELSKRFENFARCLENMNASKWTTQTYFPFITFPEEYMFMKPSVTQLAADAFAFELNYRPELNWTSYDSLLKFSNYVATELSNLNDYLKPRDMIDVQSFIWCSVPGKYY
jgi:hypothetical protein